MSGMTHEAQRSDDGTIRVWLYSRGGWPTATRVAKQLTKPAETLTQDHRFDSYFVFTT